MRLDPLELANCHSVRHLRVCVRCNGLGDGRSMLKTEGGKEHQSCFVKRNRGRVVAAVLELPKIESDKLFLGVIGDGPMRALLERNSL